MLLCYCLVAFLHFLCFLCFWCFWCAQNLFVKKINKEFKTALIISFTLLLNSSCYKQNFFLSKSFSIITMFFIIIFLITILSIITVVFITIFLITILLNHHNLFQLSQPFAVFFIIIFFITIFFHLFTTCDSIFMKISQRTNSII